MLEDVPTTPRFFIREQHGAQDVSFRVIGDLRKSRLDATIGGSDAYFPEAVDSFFALARDPRVVPTAQIAEWMASFIRPVKMSPYAMSPMEQRLSRYIDRMAKRFTHPYLDYPRSEALGLPRNEVS